MDEIGTVLKELADLDVHSIEQPIKAGTPDLMASLCKASPLPIALDEELIGKFYEEDKTRTLSEIAPQYIVLKPSLVGGFSGSQEWISLAEEQGIGWWITSALESNIGLNAIAQWVATLDTHMTQGLGTGNLYTNNFTSPIRLDGDKLFYDPTLSLSREEIAKLDCRD